MSGIVAQNTLDNTGLIKSPAGGGAWNFISKQTASADSTIDFTSGIDSTYREYLFTYNNIHPETDNTTFQFQANVAGGSGYNETITSSSFYTRHDEDDGDGSLAYDTVEDQAQGTAFQTLAYSIGNGNDECASGYLHLFNPSSTVFIKHFISYANLYHRSDRSQTSANAGYFNTTSAIDEIQFKMSSGDIDAGDICLYGITT
jgi:hypothetical protein